MFIYILLGVTTFLSCVLTVYFYHKYKFSISIFDDIADIYQDKILLELPEEDQKHILLEEKYFQDYWFNTPGKDIEDGN